ncbi:MAG: RbsD/FucU family protein [Roseburia faecis]|jgi:L-fucose mutarotase|nr:RbsD/FucU family protein [Roseburia faecis]
MKRWGCINPLINADLSAAGHGDQVLITDGNYPALSKKPPEARIVYLGLRSGEPKVTDVLKTILQEINVEAAVVMSPEQGRPEIFDEFDELLPGVTITQAGRQEFYEKASLKNVRLVISTGENRTFANILLTIGVAAEK